MAFLLAASGKDRNNTSNWNKSAQFSVVGREPWSNSIALSLYAQAQISQLCGMTLLQDQSKHTFTGNQNLL